MQPEQRRRGLRDRQPRLHDLHAATAVCPAFRVGDRFGLTSSGVTMDCHNDTLHVQGEQVLADGQTLSSGTFSCTAEPSAMKCTDSSSGHFFYMSPGSYQIG
jgi:hypothetical protein